MNLLLFLNDNDSQCSGKCQRERTHMVLGSDADMRCIRAWLPLQFGQNIALKLRISFHCEALSKDQRMERKHKVHILSFKTIEYKSLLV